MSHRIRLTTTTLAVLNVIMAGSAAEERVWGFRICELAGLGPGTVYPILDRLAQANWVSACWEATQPADRPRRRFYEMTAVGRIELADAIAARPRIGKVWGQLAWTGDLA
jgi:DNA-binding PadR family transcriptional regulator